MAAGSRPDPADPVHQSFPGSRRQTRPGLSQRHFVRLVPKIISADATRGASPGHRKFHHDAERLPDGDLGRGHRSPVLVQTSSSTTRSRPTMAMSETERNGLNAWFGDTVYSRLDNKRTGRIIVVGHRLHVDDLPGHLQRQTHEKWETLSFPAIAEVACSHTPGNAVRKVHPSSRRRRRASSRARIARTNPAGEGNSWRRHLRRSTSTKLPTPAGAGIIKR